MPDDDRPVIVNATPVIALSLLGQLDVLRELSRLVVIPALRLAGERG